jgi:CRISPR-associated protein Cmr2
MTDSILIFTFGPVQGFIAEARRAADLGAGSQILVRLARAAAGALQSTGTELVYPTNPDQDAPNVLVAIVPAEQARHYADNARQALMDAWHNIAEDAKQNFLRYSPGVDETWRSIWNRQVENLWECHWAAAPLGPDYSISYQLAHEALAAAKRTRAFGPSQEDGAKDTLGGTRSALHTAALPAREYWRKVACATSNSPGQVRPGGRERLDAIGTIKRFGRLGGDFRSVSDVATRDFCGKLLPGRLDDYKALCTELGLASWDAELLYPDALSVEHLKTEYDAEPREDRLEKAAQMLKELRREAESAPSAYFAIVRLDGDGMGEMVSKCKSKDAHQCLSKSLDAFAASVPGIVEKQLGVCIYAGGDDVLALAPVSTAIGLADDLAKSFADKVSDGHASAGITVAHHLAPLDAALRQALGAERLAKQVGIKKPDGNWVDGKNAFAVEILKRSGEPVLAVAKWTDKVLLGQALALYQNDELSTRFGYDVERASYALDDPEWRERGAALRAELGRLIERHTPEGSNFSKESSKALADDLGAWAKRLDEYTERCRPYLSERTGRAYGGAQLLVAWLHVARFLAKGGDE